MSSKAGVFFLLVRGYLPIRGWPVTSACLLFFSGLGSIGRVSIGFEFELWLY
jgi:hypothetical protein